MKTVFVLNGVVVTKASAHQEGVEIACAIPGAAAVDVPDDSPVDVGWLCQIESEGPVFSAPEVVLPLLTPMTLYMAFTPAERIAIKASKDPQVMEFWDMYQLSVTLNKPTDPNLVSVREALAYLAAPVSPGPGAGILASAARVEQIRQGIAQ